MSNRELYIVPAETAHRPPVPNNVPNRLTPLVGRGRDVEVVCRMLGAPQRDHNTDVPPPEQDVRLVTIVGPGGIGKTHLALEVARTLLKGAAKTPFEHGVYLVDLAPVVDPGLLIPAVAAVLQVREIPGQPLFSTLKEYLRSQGILLLLDNFEQIITASSVVSDLLESCPGLKILITSRAPLRLVFERMFEVQPLDVPAADRRYKLAEISEYGAVSLFVQRARALTPDFELTDRNARVVGEVCRRVDGLPLGIELVAAYAGLLTPEGILSRLKHPLEMLATDTSGSPHRHGTMRDTIEWSYRLLSQDEQRLFRQLSVFAGSFELRAAECVCNDDGDIGIEPGHPQAIQVLRVVKALVDKNLVQRLGQAESSDRRLAMLETIRAFALEKLSGVDPVNSSENSNEETDVRMLHARYYLALAEEAEPHLAGPAQLAWATRIQTEYENVRAALSTTLLKTSQTSSDHEQSDASALSAWIGLRLAGTMWQFWANRGNLAEGRRWLEMGLEAAESLHRSRPRTFDGIVVGHEEIARAKLKAFHGLGVLARLAGDIPASRSALESGLKIAREIGDRQSVVRLLNSLGATMLLIGDYGSARRFAEECLEIREWSGIEPEIGFTLTLLGNINMMEENYSEARRLHDEALVLKRRIRDKQGIGQSLHSLATIARREGNFQEARRLAEETLAIARELGNKSGVAYSQRDLGSVLYSLEDYQAAYNSFLESVQLFRELGDLMPILDCLIGVARVAVRTGRSDSAATLLGSVHAALQTTESQLDPRDRLEYEREQEELRRRLPEDVFSTQWEQGQSMSPDEGIELAAKMAEVQENYVATPSTSRGRARAQGPDGLTHREKEVAALVARGLTNPEIARDLVLSVRTIEVHVSNAMQKLGVRTRTELAAWAIFNGLAKEFHEN